MIILEISYTSATHNTHTHTHTRTHTLIHLILTHITHIYIQTHINLFKWTNTSHTNIHLGSHAWIHMHQPHAYTNHIHIHRTHTHTFWYTYMTDWLMLTAHQPALRYLMPPGYKIHTWISPNGWGSRIHWLHLCRRLRLPPRQRVTRIWYKTTSRGVMVSKPLLQTWKSEFESHWVSHSFGFLLHQRKMLCKLLLNYLMVSLQSWNLGDCWQPLDCHYYQVHSEGARGVVVIAVGNEHGDTSSNPGRDWLHFT